MNGIGSFTLSVRVFQPKFQKHGVRERLDPYLNYRDEHIAVTGATTVEDILKKCAVICEIPPLNFPLFALWNDTKEIWFKPGMILNQSTDIVNNNLQFKIRFAFKSECEMMENRDTVTAKRYSICGEAKKRVMCEIVRQYYFFQQRHDYLNDKIKITADKNQDFVEVALGVGILDVLRLSYENNGQRNDRHFKNVLPLSCKNMVRNMSIIQRFRVRRQFYQYFGQLTEELRTNQIEESEESRNNRVYKMYLRNLELIADYSHLKESYKYGINNKIEISGDEGIVLIKEENSEPDKWCDILSVTDLNIEIRPTENNTGNVYIVSLSKLNGEAIQIDLKTLVEAENLATCIDGYYRLLVDPHHYLCKDIAPPSLIRMEKLKCFGPISKLEAEHILQTKKNPKPRDCLIRQSWQNYDEYFINATYSVDSAAVFVRNYKIERNEEDALGIHGSNFNYFDSLEKLLLEIRNTNNLPFDITNLVLPHNQDKNCMLINRVKDAAGSELTEPPIPDNTQNEKYDFQENIGFGKFTQTSLHIGITTKERVVFKKIEFIKDNIGHDTGDLHCITESFSESCNNLRMLNHKFIIKFIGALIKGYVIMEYAPCKTILHYIQNQNSVGIEWIFKCFWQLAHACNYLEHRGIAHGKIRGQNILLYSVEPVIKLSDSGVKVHRLNRDNRTGVPVLPVPWLAYEFCLTDRRPSETEPTVNGDKWSFATTLCEICSCNSDAFKPYNAYSLPGGMIEKYKSQAVVPLSEQLGDSITLKELLKSCWNKIPEQRPTFRQILREFGKTLTSGYILSGRPVRLNVNNAQPQLPPAYQTVKYEDRLLFRRSPLGSGHFGTVDLYVFDRYGNGEIEKVAVKELKPGSRMDFDREFETMSRIRHKYIVELKGHTVPSNRIVMEYLEHGSLVEFIRNEVRNEIINRIPREFTERHYVQFCSQIAEAMLYLQSMERPIIHRDLALRNILLGGDKKQYIAKVSDFGLSRFMTSDYYQTRSPQDIPVQWYAPECISPENSRFLLKSDVWSYGITIWEMFSNGARPCYQRNPSLTSQDQMYDLYRNLQDDRYRLNKPYSCPDEIYRIMLQCWSYVPSDRPSFASLRESFNNMLTRLPILQ